MASPPLTVCSQSAVRRPRQAWTSPACLQSTSYFFPGVDAANFLGDLLRHFSLDEHNVQTRYQYKCSRLALRAYHILALHEYECEDSVLPLYRNYSSSNSNYIELRLKQSLNTPPLYKPDCEALPIHRLSALTLNRSDASRPKYIVQYNPVHLKGKQTMIYFRTPETVYLLQTSYTNHNSPFFLPTNPELLSYWPKPIIAKLRDFRKVASVIKTANSALRPVWPPSQSN